MRTQRSFQILALALCLAGGARAQPPAVAPAVASVAPLGSELLPAPVWAELSVSEREALRPLAVKFDSLDATQRRKWKEMAARFHSWPKDKQERVQSKMLAWASMTPEQRATARQEALARKNARPAGDNAESWRRWRELDDDTRGKLRNRALSPAQPPLAAPQR